MNERVGVTSASSVSLAGWLLLLAGRCRAGAGGDGTKMEMRHFTTHGQRSAAGRSGGWLPL